jgi:hypothetical protein
MTTLSASVGSVSGFRKIVAPPVLLIIPLCSAILRKNYTEIWIEFITQIKQPTF